MCDSLGVEDQALHIVEESSDGRCQDQEVSWSFRMSIAILSGPTALCLLILLRVALTSSLDI